jgi:hypothetical protein
MDKVRVRRKRRFQPLELGTRNTGLGGGAALEVFVKMLRENCQAFGFFFTKILDQHSNCCVSRLV